MMKTLQKQNYRVMLL